jgi:hypothetical protein
MAGMGAEEKAAFAPGRVKKGEGVAALAFEEDEEEEEAATFAAAVVVPSRCRRAAARLT